MAFKILLGFLLMTLSSGSLIAHHGHHAPQPYKFVYNIKDHEGAQHRHEEGDGHGGVRGSYGYTDHKGIYREVHYVADHNGFRATVKTNEPGTANQDPAAVKIHSSADLHHHHHHHSVPLVHTPVHHHSIPLVHTPVHHQVVPLPHHGLTPHHHHHHLGGWHF